MKIRALALSACLILSFAGVRAQIDTEEAEHSAGGFVFFAPGAVIEGGHTSGVAAVGGGADGWFPNGLGVIVEGGYLFNTSHFGNGAGSFSPGVAYRFNTAKKTQPFVTCGYTLAFREGLANVVHFGGGVTHWFKEGLGLRLEFRDQIFADYTKAQFVQVRVGLAFR